MRCASLGALAIVCSVALPAQVPAGHWTSWLFGLGPGSCGVCAYDPSGTQVAGLGIVVFGGGTVAKSPQGLVWIADSNSGVVRGLNNSSQVATILSPAANQVAVAGNGDVITAAGGLFTGVVASRFTPSGNTLWSVPLGNGLPVALRVDGSGQTWVANGLLPNLTIISPIGAVSPPVSLGPGQIRSLDLDVFGRAFVLVAPGGGSTAPLSLRRLDNSGMITATTTIADAVYMALDGCGRIHVLVNTGMSQSMLVVEPEFLTVVNTIPLVTPATYTTFTLDAVGNYFLTNVQVSRLDVATAGGVFSANISSVATPAEAGLGDPTGLRLVAAVDPDGDADLDGISNRRELWLRSDPFQATSVPPVLTLTGTPSGGNTIFIQRQSPSEAGLPYVLGASLGTGGINLGPVDCRTIPLTLDSFLLFWIDPANVFATGVQGLLDPMGFGATTINLPPIPLTGLTIHFAMVVFNPLAPIGVGSITDALSVTML